ncbi:DUF2061 domain-containing protein [Salegentibacter sp. LM13S]|nr:DUF2061 domain-containing protein [Salegentibacter lacus]
MKTGSLEVVIKMALYYLHERIGSKCDLIARS